LIFYQPNTRRSSGVIPFDAKVLARKTEQTPTHFRVAPTVRNISLTYQGNPLG